jgi:membrane-associated phospholipid phosphatase
MPTTKPSQTKAQKKVETAVAPKHVRRYRAAVFQGFVVISTAVFVALAIAAHTSPYFPIDLKVTHFVQNYHGLLYDRFLYGLSWLGFTPQVWVLGVLSILVLFLAGLRWEALTAVIAGCGSGVGTLVKLVVYRPRPTPDLVKVFAELHSYSFPSGHVLTFTVFGGFMAFLAFTVLKPSWGRTLLLVVLGVVIGFMGISRIYLGQHWFSDVMGAYVFGSLWLVLTIKLYRWGKPRFFVRQPVARETPAAGTAAAKAS